MASKAILESNFNRLFILRAHIVQSMKVVKDERRIGAKRKKPQQKMLRLSV